MRRARHPQPSRRAANRGRAVALEGRAFDQMMSLLPQEVSLALVAFVFVVLFYPKLVEFLRHFSPRARAIRQAQQELELATLREKLDATAPDTAEAPAEEAQAAVAPAAAAIVPPFEAAPLQEETAAEPAPSAPGIRNRFRRFGTTQLVWCFAGALLVGAAATTLQQVELADRFGDSGMPLLTLVPQVLVFNVIYSLGIAVVGVVGFGNRGRWGSLLLGIVLALGLLFLNQYLLRIAFQGF